VRSLRYRLFLPTPPHERMPLLVALHGCTQNAADFEAGTAFDAVAERERFVVLYPEQPGRANPNHCWNWFNPEHQFRSAGEPAAILELVETTIERYSLDRSRIYVAGLSAGGAMAAILAEQAPDVFAAVGIMAGVALHSARDLASAYRVMARVDNDVLVPRVPAADRRFHRLRATIWAGLQDRRVDPNNASVLARQFARLAGLGREADTIEDQPRAKILRWHDERGRLRIEERRLAGVGHAWSGGSLRGSYTDPWGPDATEAMAAFFLQDRPALEEDLAAEEAS
jgi:poly(hydroxyalkanoate) depolymerase family esterase